MDGSTVIKLDQQGNQTDFLSGLAGPLSNGFIMAGLFSLGFFRRFGVKASNK
jgi:hypothetical protein